MSDASQSRAFIWEALDLIGSTTILGVSYGIALTLYFLCARSLYLQLQVPDKRRQARFTLAYISILLFCATCILAMNTRIDQLAYTNHADFLGGPLEYEALYNPTNNFIYIADAILDLIVETSLMGIKVCH